MKQQSRIGVGVIGLGFMGQTHARAYHRAMRDGFPCELVAVCDGDPAKLAGASAGVGNLAAGAAGEQIFDPKRVRTYANPQALLDDPRVNLVSICTYTETHVDLAIDAVHAGKHVLVEKPVALNSAEVRRLANAARNARTLCMPAMCMRFWPEWEWLRARIHDQSFGEVRSATFQRLGSMPQWSRDFYANIERSGGALIDLHIHDVDFIYWCFGQPVSVSSAGNMQHVTTTYEFESGPHHVVAEGALDLLPTAGFRMRYLVNFERATVDFDIKRAPKLILHGAENSETVNCCELTGYDGEMRHIVAAIADGRTDLRATIDESARVIEILEAERRSLETGVSCAIGRLDR